MRTVKFLTLLLAMLAAGAAAGEPRRIVVLGDSLTAGYQLSAEAAFPEQLQRTLKARGHDVMVENAGVSGDTASAGLARLDWAVPEGTAAVIVELGANDALRGLDPEETEAALEAILARLKARGIAVLLAGMRAPPNLGPEYATAFDALYPRLAARHGVAFYPFFLDGVAAERALNLADGMHPNPAGVTAIVERILPHVEALLRASPQRSEGAPKTKPAVRLRESV